jgi:hypothetical protein
MKTLLKNLKKGNEFRFNNTIYIVKQRFLDWKKNDEPYLRTTDDQLWWHGELEVEAIQLSKQNIISELTGEKTFTYAGRLVRTVRQINGLNQVMMAVIGLSDEDQEYNIEGEWERLDCDIFIIPRKKYRLVDSDAKNARLDQVMGLLGEEKSWREV